MQTTFRNIEDIELKDGDFVDAGSLWQKVEDIMILVDEDRYVEQAYDEENSPQKMILKTQTMKFR